MSRKSKQELLDTVRPRYYKAGRKEKKRILDELVANTGYQRKYIIQVLKHRLHPRGAANAEARVVTGCT